MALENPTDPDARWQAETAEVDEPFDIGTGEVIPPSGQPVEEPLPPNPLEPFITKELCAGIFAMPGNLQARRTGHEFWRLENEEKDLLGAASQPVLVYLVRKYLNDGVGMFAGLATALAAVYGPRQLMEMQEQAKEKKNPKPQQSAADPAPPHPSAPMPRPSNVTSRPSSVNAAAVSQSSNSEYQGFFNES